MTTYLDDFKVGDSVQVLKTTNFIDGTSHTKGDVLEVTKENVSYFNHRNNKNNYHNIRARTKENFMKHWN